jgi:DNA-binding GntR family transcriptional regulator
MPVRDELAHGGAWAPSRPPVTNETVTGDLPTYRRAVYERLRQMVASFELAPGERLIESRLAERLGVSKTPIREAIGLLEADGLVQTVPHRGAVTSWLSVNEMSEQGFLLDSLEMPAYPIVVERITQQELTAIGRISKDLVKARRAGDEQGFGVHAVAIHRELFRCTGYPRLQKLIRLVLGPVGLRYDKALVYPFDDAWDVLLELSITRYEAIRARDVDLVMSEVRRLRGILHAMAMERVMLPEVARYFRED